MKFKTILLLAIIASIIAGCQPGDKRTSQNIDYSKIAGTWKTEKGPWQVTISEDGKVTSAVIQLFEAELKPHHVTTIEMIDGSKSYLTTGDFILIYNGHDKELEVVLEISKIDVHYKDEYLKGNKKIVYSGPVSDDMNTWNAEMLQVFDYGPRFPVDPNVLDIRPIIFKKQSDS